MDGDSLPDLVWTADPNQVSTKRPFIVSGNHYWKVFKSNGTGFEKSPMMWPIPVGPDGGFFNTNGFASNWSWSLVDMDGDKRPDLVWTADPSQISVKSPFSVNGNHFWKVYKNNGSGFNL